MIRSTRVVIFFDIDGTLIDHDAAELMAVAGLRGRVEHNGDASAFLQRWRSAFERHYSRYLAGELSIQQQRRERFREVLDQNLSDAAADRLSAAYIDEYLAACELYPDVKPTLMQLASYSMGVISNGDHSQQRHKLLKSGIGHYFGQLTVSGECGVAKPAPHIFELACHSMGVPPSQAIYVGDRRDIDAEAARSAGMHGIWLDRLGVPDHNESLVRIISLSELPRTITLLEQSTRREYA